MKRSFVLITAASLLAIPAAVSAQDRVCPPGEARTSTECVRPGVAKNVMENRQDARQDRRENVMERREDLEHPVLHDLAVGKILDRDYADIVDFERLGLPRPGAGMAYWQVNDSVIVAVDKQNREVKRIIPIPQ